MNPSSKFDLKRSLQLNESNFQQKKAQLEAMVQWAALISNFVKRVLQPAQVKEQISDLTEAQNYEKRVKALEHKVSTLELKDKAETEATQLQELVAESQSISHSKSKLLADAQILEKEKLKTSEQHKSISETLNTRNQAFNQGDEISQEIENLDRQIESSLIRQKQSEKEFRHECNLLDQEFIEIEAMQPKFAQLQTELKELQNELAKAKERKIQEQEYILDICHLISEVDCLSVRTDILLEDTRHEIKDLIENFNDDNLLVWEEEIRTNLQENNQVDKYMKYLEPIEESMKNLEAKKTELQEKKKQVKEDLEQEISDLRETIDQAIWLKDQVYQVFKQIETKSPVDFNSEKEFGVRTCATLFNEIRSFEAKHPDIKLLPQSDEKVEPTEADANALSEFQQESEMILDEIQALKERRLAYEKKKAGHQRIQEVYDMI